MGQDFSLCVLKDFHSTLIDKKGAVHTVRQNCQCEIAFSSTIPQPDREYMLLVLQRRYNHFGNSVYIEARLCRLIVWS